MVKYAEFVSVFISYHTMKTLVGVPVPNIYFGYESG
jgi:hypothetical protein